MTTEPRTRSHDPHLNSAFQRSVDEGEVRLSRSWPQLLATGFVGGLDLGIGVLGLLIVEAATGSKMLGALAFSIGFIALTLARSELFTENFFVPVAATVARKATVGSLIRLWFGTFVANLAAGWAVTALIVSGLPSVRETAVEVGTHYGELGFTWEAFALGLMAGAAITVMTWMERGARTEGGRVVAAATIGWLLAAGPLNHAVVSSLEMFAALHVGAPFGYVDWLGALFWSTGANMIGGLLLVTVLRLIQIGPVEIVNEIRRPKGGTRDDDERGEDESRSSG